MGVNGTEERACVPCCSVGRARRAHARSVGCDGFSRSGPGDVMNYWFIIISTLTI
jgi:hypothetical protein